MKKLIPVLLAVFAVLISKAQGIDQTDYPYHHNQTYTFKEVVKAYEERARLHSDVCRLTYFGSSDYGIPVPLFIINSNGIFTKEEYQSKNVILINNAIHPGEPCGVDACVRVVDNLLKEGKTPENVIIAIIPIYNIGGAMNRNCCSRANQNGPEEYGFRGNSNNLDLNRDFIKADSKNTRAFYQIFHLLEPDIFVDTHTSNGADYMHTMTLITSQLNKMTNALAEYTKGKLNPELYNAMEVEYGIPMVPYVHSVGKTPFDGIQDYLETPRYSTGYTNLFNAISYVSEAHMLKSYEDRVAYTISLLHHIISHAERNPDALTATIEKANQELLNAKELPLNWKLDTTQYEDLYFWGYKAGYKKSEVTGVDRLYYDQKKRVKQNIKYFNTYTPVNYVSVPDYYIIPQSRDNIVELLLANDIEVYRLTSPQQLDVEAYYIDSYETVKNPYESHYLHYNIEASKVLKTMDYQRGDYIIPTNNINVRFIVETLEPEAPDSYFAWNYFDGILQQKEWFSAYVFEDEAAEMLKNDPELKAKLEEKKATDSSFASNDFAQLYFLYKQSDHYERTANFYPVTRLNSAIDQSKLIQVSSVY